MNREKQLRHQLHRLHVEYREKAQPLIDELVKIRASKPPRGYVIWDEASNITPEMFERWRSDRGPIGDALGYALAGGKPEQAADAVEGER